MVIDPEPIDAELSLKDLNILQLVDEVKAGVPGAKEELDSRLLLAKAQMPK